MVLYVFYAYFGSSRWVAEEDGGGRRRAEERTAHGGGRGRAEEGGGGTGRADDETNGVTDNTESRLADSRGAIRLRLYVCTISSGIIRSRIIR